MRPAGGEVWIYDGRNCLGRAVELHSGEWVARAADGHRLGVHTDRGAAIAAIKAAVSARTAPGGGPG